MEQKSASFWLQISFTSVYNIQIVGIKTLSIKMANHYDKAREEKE